MIICDNCHGTNVIDNTCQDCGMVLREDYVALPERSYDKKDRIAGSIIKFNTPDLEVYNTHGKKTSNKALASAFSREKYYSKYSYFYEGYVEIKRIIDQLKLPKYVLKEATVIFRKLIDENFFKDHHIKQGIYAALVKLSCGIWDTPITFEEVAQFSNYSVNEVKRSYLSLRREREYSFNRAKIQKFLIKYLDNYELSKEERKKAAQLALLVESHCRTSGKNPMGYVAAIFNILGLSRKRVVIDFPVSAPTVTVRKREILKLINKIEESKK